MDLEGRKIAILVADQYQELEVWYPLLRFREDGAETVAVGAEIAQTYLSKKGYPVVSDEAIVDAHVSDFDAVVIPGGWAPEALRQDPNMVRFVRDMNAAGKVVGAICHAGWMLVSTGIARGRRVTCYRAIKDDVLSAGGQYVDEQVVVDDNLITSRMPTDLPAFCREIKKVLVTQAVAAGAGTR